MSLPHERAVERESADDGRRGPLRSRVQPLESGRGIATALVLALLLLASGVLTVPQFAPISLIFPVLVVAGLLLEPRSLALVLGVATLVVLVWAPNSGLTPTRVAGVLLAVGVVMWLVVVIARSRARVGVRGFSGDRMFAELRDRIASVGQVPSLPEGWTASASILSAHGDRFSGDFVIAHLTDSEQCLEVTLVDVSGKGEGAGTRSLLLSGALGGLLGAVPPERFLGAANACLLRQRWEEGFATAVHMTLDLRTGDYSLANAGHPAPARYTSGRARWTVLDTARGPLLGLLPDAEFPRQSGRLGSGDALLLYSDGVIEARDRDLTDGIDRMLGVAAMSVLRQGDVARDVCDSARSGEDDDRAAFAVHRR